MVRSMQQEREAGQQGAADGPEGAVECIEEGVDEGGYAFDGGSGVLIFGEASEARKLRRFDGRVRCSALHVTPLHAAKQTWCDSGW